LEIEGLEEKIMASTTKKVKVRRAIAIARQGRKRKNHDRIMVQQLATCR